MLISSPKHLYRNIQNNVWPNTWAQRLSQVNTQTKPSQCQTHLFSMCVTRSVVSDSLRPHGLYVSCQALLSVEFSRQECWSGLTFPSPGDLPNPGIEPTSSALADTFLKPHDKLTHMRKFYITRCSQKHPRIASLPKGTNQFHQKENFCFFLLGAQP